MNNNGYPQVIIYSESLEFLKIVLGGIRHENQYGGQSQIAL